MQVIPFKIHYPEGASLHIQENRQPYQYDLMHVHPELQISMVLAGQGKLRMDNVDKQFVPGDVFVIAPDVPHIFQNDPSYYEEDNKQYSHFISIFFRPEILERSFSSLAEMLQIRQFLHRLQSGLKIQADYTRKLRPLFTGLSRSPIVIQWAYVIQILYLLVQNEYKESIRTGHLRQLVLQSQQLYKRLEPVFEYLQENLEKSISLKQVCKLSHMSESSFSRYFKQCTRKSFSSYLNELRIQKACQLLLETDFSVYHISLETGYPNLSNFNRHFKRLVKLTPSQFRKKEDQREE